MFYEIIVLGHAIFSPDLEEELVAGWLQRSRSGPIALNQ
jgi:hypothetical protein